MTWPIQAYVFDMWTGHTGSEGLPTAKDIKNERSICCYIKTDNSVTLRGLNKKRTIKQQLKNISMNTEPPGKGYHPYSNTQNLFYLKDNMDKRRNLIPKHLILIPLERMFVYFLKYKVTKSIRQKNCQGIMFGFQRQFCFRSDIKSISRS